jgi:hypothetical protein
MYLESPTIEGLNQWGMDHNLGDKMTHVIYNSPIDGSKGTNEKIEVTVIPQPDGSVTLTRSDGTVLAPEPVNTPLGLPWKWNPNGTHGAYERAMLQGTIISYYPATGFYAQYPIFALRP